MVGDGEASEGCWGLVRAEGFEFHRGRLVSWAPPTHRITMYVTCMDMYDMCGHNIAWPFPFVCCSSHLTICVYYFCASLVWKF